MHKLTFLLGSVKWGGKSGVDDLWQGFIICNWDSKGESNQWCFFLQCQFLNLTQLCRWMMNCIKMHWIPALKFVMLCGNLCHKLHCPFVKYANLDTRNKIKYNGLISFYGIFVPADQKVKRGIFSQLLKIVSPECWESETECFSGSTLVIPLCLSAAA